MLARKKKHLRLKRAIALFLLITIVNQVLAPTVAYALTAGPTAPEATNFEPIDTTDMVNPLTGSFTYGMPLLEVPGPEGSYPLALSYHAGIQPNEEASWVGLGWSLNPGAISRNVNGYPDDWKGQDAISRSYWSGGVQTTLGVGIDIPIPLPGGFSASVNFGLQFAHDTYKGFGVGYSAGASFGYGYNFKSLGIGIGASISGEVGVDPWGHSFSSVNLGVGLSYSHGLGSGNLTGTANIGLSTNFKSVSGSVSGSVGYTTTDKDKDGKPTKTNHSLLGASLNSSSGGVHISVGGGEISMVNNANAGRVSTQTTGWSIPFGIGSVSYSETRYWSDEIATVSINGVLYSHPQIYNISDMDNADDDNYQLPDYLHLDNIKNPDPDIQAGGTFPDFDNYSVTAQGLSGDIRPYGFQKILFRQNKLDNVNGHAKDIHADAVPLFDLPANWQFRFIGDLSNYYGQGSPYTSDSYDASNYNFDSSPKYGKINNDGTGTNDGSYGYDAQTNRLEGSKHIEYFTNTQITNGTAAARGFITIPDEAGFARSNCPADQIGGFMITNESGVTYHYALPAFENSEEAYSKKISEANGLYSNDFKKNAKYAYTWYLTAVTGPDYVSRGLTAGLIDPKNDYGYWVKCDYGLWNSTYQWRTPAQGYKVDLNSGYENYTSGSKEVYYLDAVETRSHTALFEKEIRADGKDVTGFNGFSIPFQGLSNNNYTASSLRLNNIYLFQNNQLPLNINSIRNSNTLYQQSFTLTSYTPSGSNDHGTISHTNQVQPVNGQNIIDKYDITPTLLLNCLRKISFNYDYSLSPGCPNSYDDTGGFSTYFQNYDASKNYTPSSLLGRLTLKSVDMQGKGGVSMTPPTQFQYDLDPNDPKNQETVSYTAPVASTVTQDGNSLTLYTGTISPQTTTKLRVGDIITFLVSGISYYCTLTSATDNTNSTFNVRYLNNAPPGTGSGLQALKTKNPPYNKDAYDMWGCYKSDYIAGTGNENQSRITSPVSNKSTDVWSLRKLFSSQGATITVNYEGQTYNNSVLSKNRSLILNNSTFTSANGTVVSGITRNAAQDYTFRPVTLGLDLTQIYNVGDYISMVYTIEDAPLTGANCLVYTTDYPNNNSIAPLGTNYINNPNGIPPVYQPTNNAGQWVYGNPDAAYTSAPKVIAVGTDWVEVQTGVGMEEEFYGYFNRVNKILGQPNFPTANYINFGTGNLFLGSNTLLYGGGMRVKELVVDDLNGNVNKTAYDYSIPGSLPNTITSSGVTSYEPLVFDTDNLDNYQGSFNNFSSDVKTAYRSNLSKYHNKLLAIAREVPAPGVMYEYVAVTDSAKRSDGKYQAMEGKTLYNYEVFKEEMIGVYQNNYNVSNFNSTVTLNTGTGINDQNYKLNKRTRNNMAIKDYTSRIGSIKRVITYDQLGNKLTEKINHFLYDDLDNTSLQNQINYYEPRLAAYNNMGVIKERYGSIRLPVASVDKNNNPTSYDELWMMSNKETFPTIQTGTTQIDYKNGTKMDQTNLAYDFYTGAITQTLTTDSYGNRFISVVTPAYSIYPALGLKTHDDDPGAVQHKQMLSQQASDYTFSVDPNNNPIGVITATAQTWSSSVPVLDPTGNSVTDGSQSNIWRMEKSYKWMPTGTSANNVQPYSSFVDFYSTSNQTSMNASWKKTSQITQYNVYSAALEASDINNNYAATRMGYNNSKVLFTGGIARYNEIAYAGAEDAMLANGNFSNQISPGGGTVVTDSTLAHTGVNSLMVPPGADGFNYTVPVANLNPAPQNYNVAVWVKPAPGGTVNQATLYYQVPGGARVSPTQTYTKTASGSYLLEMMVPASALTASSSSNPGGSLVVGCNNGSQNTLYFDDFRFQPTAASATAYVYDSRTGELTYILGNSNLYTRFQYDAIGRLVRTYNELLGKPNSIITQTIRYNYGKYVNTGTTGGGTPPAYTYYNVAMSQSFNSSKCAAGAGFGLPITYTVPAWTYFSNTSQTDADNQARNDLKTNGPTYADKYGTCSAVNFVINNNVGTDYYVTFYNSSGAAVLNPLITANTASTTIQVPVGTYTIYVYQSGSGNYNLKYKFMLWDGTTFTNTPIANFTGVNLVVGSSIGYSLTITTP